MSGAPKPGGRIFTAIAGVTEPGGVLALMPGIYVASSATVAETAHRVHIAQAIPLGKVEVLRVEEMPDHIAEAISDLVMRRRAH